MLERSRHENYKLQITNKFQITMTKITKINKKRITTIIMGHDIKKQSTMFDLVSKAFAGGPGGQFSRKEPPWPPEAIW
jgi:hypothetical protein